MSNTAQISATGASGTKHTFTIYPLNTPFSAVGGVYLILRQNTVLYVGQTGDLSNRFDAHHKESCWLRQQADRMAAIAVSGERERLQIEADLINAYNPACNG
jgi:excinuclease UvrABC nuclease subunit